ncbi:unnamed protein product [Paramecium sonneborni]|uniref:Uncharacterized protein n=1 Tax=Paramecium sonneborni TaxID=65129 RepID=A0A8S1RMR1_9CILI|nr:unnamed protein product [Paramecium sonneborni]
MPINEENIICTNSIEINTHNLQKSLLFTQEVLNGRAIRLKLIKAESSLNEQSDDKVFESLRKQQALLNIIIRLQIHWSQRFACQSINYSYNHKKNMMMNLISLDCI